MAGFYSTGLATVGGGGGGGGGMAIGGVITGATQGSILFAGVGGILAQDNANLFFDDTNNQLKMGNGTITLPAYSFGSSAGTGFYSPVTGFSAISSAGTNVVTFGSSSFSMYGSLANGGGRIMLVPTTVLTTNATPTLLITMATISNEYYNVNFSCTATYTDNSNRAAWQRSFLVKNVAGTTSVVSTSVFAGLTAEDVDGAFPVAASALANDPFSINISGTSVQVLATGVLATNIRWKSEISYLRIN